MVEAKPSPGISDVALYEASEAISRALDSGVEVNELVSMVRQLALEETECGIADVEQTLPEPEYVLSSNGEERIYSRVPEGMIDIATAARKYGRSLSTIRGWVIRGTLASTGRLRGSAGSGGGAYLVQEEDLLQHVLSPVRKGGRPRKLA